MPDPRPLPEGPLHFVGIGGAGMSALAFVLASRGVSVTGSDPGISTSTKTRLESVGCKILPGPHAKTHLPEKLAGVIVTDAVKDKNPEVSEAEQRGIPIFKRPEALGSLVNSAKTAICIAGTHGKTTTTGMVASILIHAGLNPTVLIGGDLPLMGGNARNGDPDLIVAEACEAYGGLDWLKPTIAVILNMEPDHLDFHGSAANFRKAFLNFGRRIRPLGSIVFTHTSDLVRLAQDIKAKDARDVSLIACAVVRGDAFIFADSVEWNQSSTRFETCFEDWGKHPFGIFEMPLPGIHNLQNALIAIGVAYCVYGGFPEDKFNGIETFTGTGRRFEKLGATASNITVIDDYAHHPTEIRATLQGARQAYPNNRLIAVFQPHLPSRTRDFLDGFADALANGGADAVYLTEIFPSREVPQPGLIELLADKVAQVSLPPAFARPSLQPTPSPASRGEEVTNPQPSPSAEQGRESRGTSGGRDTPCTLIKDRFELPARLKIELLQGDVAIFMGAGNIREQAEAFLKL